MRANVNIENDAYNFAVAYASAKGITLGSAISELLRRAERAPQPESDRQRLRKNEFGYFEITGGTALTLETVKDLSEDGIA